MITFYDNNGETADRYTMAVKRGNVYDMYTFSTNALMPDGINMAIGEFEDTYTKEHEHALGGKIEWDNLPMSVQIACLQRLDPRNN